MPTIGKVLKLIRTLPTETHTGTIIFLPGAGMTGFRLRGWIRSKLGRDLSFPHLKILYPTATQKFYTPWKGKFISVVNVWFDRQGSSHFYPEDPDSLSESTDQLTELVYEEYRLGIPITKIIIGGFAMGGIMALHLCYRTLLDVAGVFAMSSYLSRRSDVYKALEFDDQIRFPPPLFMSNGDRDRIVPYYFGLRTFEKLTSRGVEGHFQQAKNTGHTIEARELALLRRWILRIIPNK